MNKFEAFKEITLGGIQKEYLLKKLIDVGIQFNQYAEILFDHPQFSPSENGEKVKLVKVKLADLGVNKTFSFQEMLKCATELGLKLCPLYLGAFLRLEYLDQPVGPYLTIVSAQPEFDENFPKGFYIRNFDKTLWLRGYCAGDFCDWPDENEFIFIK